MAFQHEVGSGSLRATSRHDWLNKRVQFLTAQHVATVTVTNGGTATYVVGDIMTLTPSTACDHFPCRFEVTGVTAGVIDSNGLAIRDSGAFTSQVASAIVGAAAGNGYNVGDIIEVQGGTSRCPAKFQVATLTGGAGSGVATVTLFEGGGAYSADPALTDAATVGVGPNGYGGDDVCNLDITMTGLTGLTGLAITGGSGGGSPTVTITLAQTGWTVDGRNTNSTLITSSGGAPDDDQEKEVVLKGDATGMTNKPFIAYRTFTEDVTINSHCGIAVVGLIAHNPAIALWTHTPKSPGLLSATAMDVTGAYSMMRRDTTGFNGTYGTVDLWFGADDNHFREVAQIFDGAGSADASAYWQHYAGFLDRIGTETENPYPLYVFASTRDATGTTDATNNNHTSLVEQRIFDATLVGSSYVYDHPNGVFASVRNADGVATPTASHDFTVAPANYPKQTTGTSNADWIVRDIFQTERSISIFGSDNGTNATDRKVFTHADRAAPFRVLRWVPGTTPVPFLWPLTLTAKLGTAADPNDRLLGNIQGCFWVSSDNGSGARIPNFSEDFLTVNGDRYYVFHNAYENGPQQYMAFKVLV